MVRMRGCCRCGEERRDDGRTFWCDTSANKGEGEFGAFPDETEVEGELECSHTYTDL